MRLAIIFTAILFIGCGPAEIDVDLSCDGGGCDFYGADDNAHIDASSEDSSANDSYNPVDDNSDNSDDHTNNSGG